MTGKNFTSNSIVRWGGSNRKTTLLNGALYATITAQDIAKVTTAKIDVLDSKTNKVSNVFTFSVTGLSVGIAELTTSPAGSPQSAVGLTTIFHLRWTHTTETWRALDEMDLRLVDGDLIPLWVRYQETRDENGADVSRKWTFWRS